MALDRPPTPAQFDAPNDISQRKHLRSTNTLVDFYFKHWSAILLTLELILNLYFIYHGPLHPIDYPTYLIQARQIRLGERDYAKIHGPTGPLVYPGGHVVIFGLFERLFGIKGDVDWDGYLPAQWIFLILQLLQTYVITSIGGLMKVVHEIYRISSPLPQLDCIFFLLTIRARNVFENGLFNDPFQTLFSYLGVLFLLRRRYTASLVFFSLGVSIKMSGLLWAPGVAVYLISTIGLERTFQASWAGILVQILVAWPFRSHLWHYIHQSFELDRTFTWFNVCNSSVCSNFPRL